MSDPEGDLVVLVPDKNMESSVHGLLSRPEALGIRRINFNIHVHIERDPGCFQRGHDFLRPMAKRYSHALIMFDLHGCGYEASSKEQIEEAVGKRLSMAGWNDRGEVVVLDPELEVWVWSDSPHVGRCLGWRGQQPDLRTWLSQEGMWEPNASKPKHPKAAMELALRQVKKPRSSSLYQGLATSVSLQRCEDPAFGKFKSIMHNWFAENHQ